MVGKKDFECFWQKNYNGILPLGYILRDYFFDDRWFRIHSLPNSKRYADSEDEMRIILERQNGLIDDLLSEKNNYLQLLYHFSETSTSKCFSKIDNVITLDSIQITNENDDIYLNLAIINKIWENGSIDSYLKAIANDEPIISNELCEVYHGLIIDTKKNRIIAPYDGGVDIILNTMQERDDFKLKYKDWLSQHYRGL